MRPGDAGWPVGLRDSVRGQASGPWEPTTGAGSGCVRGPRGVGGACVTSRAWHSRSLREETEPAGCVTSRAWRRGLPAER